MNDENQLLFIKQINKELYSAYHYLEFSAYFQTINQMENSKFYQRIAENKITNAMLAYIYHYKVSYHDQMIEKLKEKKKNNQDLLDIISNYTRETEENLIDDVYQLYDQSSTCDDEITMEFLDWLIVQKQKLLEIIKEHNYFEDQKMTNMNYFKH